MNQITCTCSAYHFPHRQNGGNCQIGDLLALLEENGIYVSRETAVTTFDAWGSLEEAARDIALEARTPHPASIRY